MKSPFPGMDPYLERRWQDVHQAICTYARDQINEQLRGNLVARLGERLVVESAENPARTIYPDVRVIEEGEGATAVAVLEEAAEPLMISLDVEPEPQAFIEITEVESGRLITVIEFLSASNKTGAATRRLYKRKQRELFLARVNLVELDFLRAGRRVFIVPSARFPANAKAPYFASIVRARAPEVLELYPISLRKPLPALRIPLRPSDPDVVLRLQPLIEQAYRNGRYELTDYTRPCDPPLQGDDADWADALLKTAGKRS